MSLSLTKKICEILIKRKVLSETELTKAKKVSEERGVDLRDILIEMGAFSKECLLAILSEDMGIPPMDLSRYKIDDDIIRLIPKKISEAYQMLPISRIGKQLTVAMVDPLNIFALDDMKVMTSMDISPVIVEEDDLKTAIHKYFEKTANEEISEIVQDIAIDQMEMIGQDDELVSFSELFSVTEEAPVVKLINMMLSKGVKERASDILIEPMESRTRVRFRVDGILKESYEPPKKYHQTVVSRIKVMSDLDIAERRLPQDGRFMIKIEGRKVDFRVSIVPSSYGEKIALRILDKEQARIDLDTLGFNKRDIEKMKASSGKPHGMVLVCGPTGCGKTTTLYSILMQVNDPGKNLVTVEDPVEFELKGINQVSINDELGLTFSACLRSILRQDPDVIMVGEIRDFETLDVAIKSALTGHMVLSTLHTNTAAESVVRMINMGIDPFLITASVEIIVSQRLLRSLCPSCREAYMPTREMAEKYGLFDAKGKIVGIFKPKGCKRCMDTGYQGRKGIAESMVLSPAVKDLIFKNAQVGEIEKAARLEGMTTLRENGIENVLKGIASLEDVLRITAQNDKIEK